MQLAISSLHRADQRQDLLGEGNKQATEQAQQALRPLAGVVALDAHTHLHDAPAKNDDADGLMIEKMKSDRLLTMLSGSLAVA